MHDPSRRRSLARLSRAAAALALGSLFAPRLISGSPQRLMRLDGPANEPFTLGVASGQPRPTSVVLWTRLAPQPHEPGGGLPPLAVPVRWQVAADERFASVVREGTVDALPEHAHSVHVLAEGLAPQREYFYRFIAGDAVSRTGRTRTAPPLQADVARLRIALGSCQHYEQGRFAAQREIAQRDLDFVLFVGDYIYESSNASYRLRPHEAEPPTTLDGYRARHATYKLDADLAAAHAAHPWLMVWDDHEVQNDYAGDMSAKGMDAQAFLRLRAAAYKAYFEHMPVSPAQAPADGAMRMHDHFTWGRLAELWTLDGRQYRSVQACGSPAGSAGGRLRLRACDELGDPARSVFGAAQERWLADGLTASERTWKLLGQGTQMSPWGVDMPFSRARYTDGWDGYPAARERLLQMAAQARVGNLVSLGGDVHRHVAANLRVQGNEPGSPIVGSEFITTSLTTRGLPEPAMQAIRASNPDLLHARSDERGYTVLEITPKTLACEFRATAFPVADAAALHTQARFVVESGRPGPQPA
jgi:alkaline phosphatase D